MPWLSIAVWLITFLISKSSGASTGKAALLATGAGLASYYMVDPANKDNVLGLTTNGAKTVAGDPAVGTTAATVKTATSSIGSTAVSEVGSTLRSWGPTGTLGVVAGTTAIASTNRSKWLPWIAGGAALLLLTRS